MAVCHFFFGEELSLVLSVEKLQDFTFDRWVTFKYEKYQASDQVPKEYHQHHCNHSLLPLLPGLRQHAVSLIEHLSWVWEGQCGNLFFLTFLELGWTSSWHWLCCIQIPRALPDLWHLWQSFAGPKDPPCWMRIQSHFLILATVKSWNCDSKSSLAILEQTSFVSQTPMSHQFQNKSFYLLLISTRL